MQTTLGPFRVHYNQTAGLALARLFATQAEALLDQGRRLPGRGRGCRSAVVELDGARYVLKRYDYRGAWYGFRHLFRRSRALRVFRHMTVAKRGGVPVPEPYCCLERRTPGRFLRESYVLIDYFADAATLEQFWPRASDTRRDEVLVRCGQIYRRLYELSVSHGDSNWENILVREGRDGLEFALVDFDCSRTYLVKTCRHLEKDIAHFIRHMGYLNIDTRFVDKFKSGCL